MAQLTPARPADLVPGTETETILDRVAQDYGCCDSRGRAVGGRVTFLSVSWAAASPEAVAAYAARTYSGRLIYAERDGATLYAFRPQATRDGAKFGALQDRRFYATLAEAQAAAQDYFTQAAKRAAKAK